MIIVTDAMITLLVYFLVSKYNKIYGLIRVYLLTHAAIKICVWIVFEILTWDV